MVTIKHTISILALIVVLLCVYPLVCCTYVNAQCDDKNDSSYYSWDFHAGKDNHRSIGTVVSDFLTPQIILDTKALREYVRDERFLLLRSRCGDMHAIDAIYLKSLKLTEYNIVRALFLSFMAVLEHRTVDIKVPIFESLAVPLTFEEDSVFALRKQNLPSKVYTDTPSNPNGDVDKLQHFFGSAYVAYATESPGLTRTTGDFIEWVEAKIVLGGTDDPRDKRANNQGKSFGRDLLVVKTLLPSDYLTFPSGESK